MAKNGVNNQAPFSFMSRHSVIVASLLLVVFGGLLVIGQLLDYNSGQCGMESIIGSFARGKLLANIPDIVKRDDMVSVTSGGTAATTCSCPRTRVCS